MVTLFRVPTARSPSTLYSDFAWPINRSGDVFVINYGVYDSYG